MSLFISSLNSGSNGNCYYVGSEEDAVLVDAGISCREVEARLKRLKLPIERIRAIFISHEHSDHIRGLSTLSRKYGLPVYLSEQTLRNGEFYIDKPLIRHFSADEAVNFGELYVRAFSKHHDAADPYSFIVTRRHTVVGVFTDIGRPCDRLIQHFARCHAAFLEANYDSKMLDEGRYPYFLKQRIRGGNGHLSNQQALTLVQEHRPAYMSHLILAHLSQNNNCPELVAELFSGLGDALQVFVASRYAETPVFEITSLQKLSTLPEPPPAPIQQRQMEFNF